MQLILDDRQHDTIVIEDEECVKNEEHAEVSILKKLLDSLGSALSTDISPIMKVLAIALAVVVVMMVSLGIASLLFGVYALLHVLIPALPQLGSVGILAIAAIIAVAMLVWLGFKAMEWLKQLPKKRQTKIKNLAKTAKRAVVKQGRRMIEMD